MFNMQNAEFDNEPGASIPVPLQQQYISMHVSHTMELGGGLRLRLASNARWLKSQFQNVRYQLVPNRSFQ